MPFEISSLLHAGYQEPLSRDWQQDGTQILKEHLMYVLLNLTLMSDSGSMFCFENDKI